jgi:tetratricopeptide (TPR) repeat protein
MRRRRSDDTPETAVARYHALRRDGRFNESVEFLRSAVARFPESAPLALRLAAEVRAAAPDHARALIEQARSAPDADPATLVGCGDLLLALGDFDTAAEVLNGLQSPDYGGDVGAFESRLLNMSAEIAWHRDDGATAEKLFRKAYELDPTIIGNGERLARFLAFHGKVEEALAVVADALRHLPGDEFLERARDDFKGRLSAGKHPPARRRGHG